MARKGTKRGGEITGTEGIKLASLRRAYGETLVEIGDKRKDIVVLDADLAESTQTKIFREKFPERFFDMGISEQDMISTACGFALSGKTVFVSSFAIFVTGRCYNQIRNNLCYMNLNVKIVSTHGGLAVGEDGSSHQALEDISLMRGLPNMRVISPSDAELTMDVIRFIAEEKGPFYVRLLRPDTPLIHKKGDFKFGKAILLNDGEDVSIFAHGIMVHKAIEAVNILKERGINPILFEFHTIKPLDELAIQYAIQKTGKIIVVEDHSIYGGLGTAVSEYVSSNNPCKVLRLGVEGFGESGKPEMLFKKFGLTPIRIADKAEEILDRVQECN